MRVDQGLDRVRQAAGQQAALSREAPELRPVESSVAGVVVDLLRRKPSATTEATKHITCQLPRTKWLRVKAFCDEHDVNIRDFAATAILALLEEIGHPERGAMSSGPTHLPEPDSPAAPSGRG